MLFRSFIDYEKQKEFLYKVYVDLYGFREKFTEAYYCGKKQKTILKHIMRQSPPKTLDEFLKFDELFFLKEYFNLLNSENNFKYNLVDMTKFISKMTTNYKKDLDKKKALLYIYGKFIKTPQ